MNQSATQALTTVRFGIFEVDVRAGELRRDGIKVKLQEQPFRVLVMLLERPGEVVRREEIQQKLWPEDTFVDFEHSINAAVKRLREALDDSADNPRFVETLRRRGYRFIAPVIGDRAPVSAVSGVRWTPPDSADRIAPAADVASRASPLKHRVVWAALVAFAIALAANALLRPLPPPRVIRYTRLTHGAHIRWGPMATDGTRIYFNSAAQAGGQIIASVSAAGGEVVPIPMPPQRPFLEDISPDGTELLVSEFPYTTGKGFYIVPTEGGSARRLGDVRGVCGAWSADGREVYISDGQAVYAVAKEGSTTRKVMDLRMGDMSYAWPRPSPDGRKIRFTTGMVGLWEARVDGSNLHPVLAGYGDTLTACCGAWTRDGGYFLFEGRPNGARFVGDLWALRESPGLFARGSSKPVRLTSGPLTFTTPTPSKDGKRIFAVGNENRYEVVRYDPKAGGFLPFLPQVPTAYLLDFSKDGKWITYVNYPDGTLWKCRRDGSERIQLTFPPMQVNLPSWSPDGRLIAFTDFTSGGIFLISADGGAPEKLTPEFLAAYDAGWSPDGNSLVFGGTPPGTSLTALGIFDLKSRKVSKVPGSDGFRAPRWSPDGKRLAALGDGLEVFDLRDQKWTTLATQEIQYHTWSSDSKYLYFTSHVGNDWSAFRVRVADRILERVVSLQGLEAAQDVQALYPWFGLAPDDSLLILRDVGGQEIYALDWEAP